MIAIVAFGGLPAIAQGAIMVTAALVIQWWQRSPDADRDGIPDWLEVNAPHVARAIEWAERHGSEALVGAILDTAARRVVSDQVGAGGE